MSQLANHAAYYTNVWACFHLSATELLPVRIPYRIRHQTYGVSLQQPLPPDKGIFNIKEKSAILIT
jgi:hypothetical protein